MGQTTAARGGRGRPREVLAPSSPSTDHVAVQLGDGRKLMIPTTEDDTSRQDENVQPMDLDDDAFAKMRALRNHLDNLLKMKKV